MKAGNDAAGVARRVLASGLLCLAAPAMADLLGDQSGSWQEGEFALPAAPQEASLRAFAVSAASASRHWVDEASLSVGEDGVVRYVLVVRSPGGAQNVTFEGIRCASAQWRLYATGRDGGAWAPVADPSWRPLRDNSYNRARVALAREHFCDGPVPPRDRGEALRLLREAGGRF